MPLTFNDKHCKIKQREINVSRERNIETARNVFRLIEQSRFEEFSELFAKNGKWIHPYHSGLGPAEVVGRKEIEKFLKNIC